MLDVLDFINDATREANSFANHAGKDLSLEDRLLYLQCLALVMNSDGEIHPEEKEYLRILIKSFDMDELLLEGFVEFAQHPDKDAVQAFFRAFKRIPIAQLFLFDALMMSDRDGCICEKEKAVIQKIAEQLEVKSSTYQDIFDLFCCIKNKDWDESALYFSSHLLNVKYFSHLLEYYEVDFDDLLIKTKEMRRVRVLKKIKSRLNKPLKSDALRFNINNNLVLPIIQSGIDRGDIKVFIDNLIFEGELEVKLGKIGFGYIGESCSLYVEREDEISDLHVISYISKFLGMSIIEFYSLIFDDDIIIYAEVDETEKNLLRLSSCLEKGKIISIDNRVFEYVNYTGDDMYGSKYLISYGRRNDFFEYIYNGVVNLDEIEEHSMSFGRGDFKKGGILIAEKCIGSDFGVSSFFPENYPDGILREIYFVE